MFRRKNGDIYLIDMINMKQIMDGITSYLNTSLFETGEDETIFKLKYGEIPRIMHHERELCAHEEVAALHPKVALRDMSFYRRLTLVYRAGAFFDNAPVIMDMYWQTLKKLDGGVFTLAQKPARYRVALPSFLYNGVLFTRAPNGLIEYDIESDVEYTIESLRMDVK